MTFITDYEKYLSTIYAEKDDDDRDEDNDEIDNEEEDEDEEVLLLKFTANQEILTFYRK